MEYEKIFFHSIPSSFDNTSQIKWLSKSTCRFFFFFTLNTISCFILSRDEEAEAEAVEAIKFLWKWKHFDERDWK